MEFSLGRIVVFVNDARALADWYRQTFGFETKYDGLEEGWIELDTGGDCTLALHSLDDPEPPRSEVAFAVDDVESTRKSLAEKGVEINDEIYTWRHYQYCKGRDPEGNIFQIVNKES